MTGAMQTEAHPILCISHCVAWGEAAVYQGSTQAMDGAVINWYQISRITCFEQNSQRGKIYIQMLKDS